MLNIDEISALLLNQKTKVDSTVKKQHLSRMGLDNTDDDMSRAALLSLAPSSSSTPSSSPEHVIDTYFASHRRFELLLKFKSVITPDRFLTPDGSWPKGGGITGAYCSCSLTPYCDTVWARRS